MVSDNLPLDRLLRSAIADRRLLQLTYGGELRVAEPHDYGTHKQRLRLLAYQRSGPSRSGRASEQGWRLLDVARIEGCIVLDETFGGSRGRAHQNHYEWEVLHARVA